MLIGILSDSHGRYLPVRQAMALFDRLGAGLVVHCGDVGGAGVFDELVGRPCTFVWGNMDLPDAGLLAYLKTVGLRVPDGVPSTLTLDGKTFAVFHGHEPGFKAALGRLTKRRFPYRPDVRRDQGAACGNVGNARAPVLGVRSCETLSGKLDVDYILHGHTHIARDDRRDRTRIINPGALYRTRRKTVATLDTTTDEVTFHEIPAVQGADSFCH